MISSPSLLAVMVNWNGKAFLQKSVPSALGELQKADGKLLVVDNASSDGSVEFLRESFPQVSILQTGANLGGAGGFREGMKTALASPECRYIWLLDNDILVEENALAPLLRVLRENAGIGAAGSQICLYDQPGTVQEAGSSVTPWLAALRHHGSGGKRLPADSAPFEVDYLAACSVLIKRECLAQVGVFGNFFIFYDDVEWGLRAKKLGWRLAAVPASVIRHHYGMIKPIVPWREYYRKRNRLAVIAACPPSRGGRLASLLYLVFLNYILLLARWRGDQPLHRAWLWARDDALAGRLGKRDLDGLASDGREEAAVNNLADGTAILIDIAESAGDALAAIRKLREANPGRRLCFTVRQQEYLRYFELPDLEPFRSEKHYDLAVVGARLCAGTIRSSSRLYRFAYGFFCLLPHPRLELFEDQGQRILALLRAVLVTPRQWLQLLWRYRDGGRSTFAP